MPRWNLRKANWDKYTKYIEENINRIKPMAINYKRFTSLIKTAATKAIPRGHRKNYIPCWTKECEKLLNEYEQNNNEVSANHLINLLDEERRKRWVSAVEELDFTRSSRKSWTLLRKLGAAHPIRKEDKITPNEISSKLFNTSNIKPDSRIKADARRTYANELSVCNESTT